MGGLLVSYGGFLRVSCEAIEMEWCIYRCPMTPVLITRELSFSTPLHSSTFLPICTASSRPPLPVTALAQPELITTARIPSPLRLCRVFLLTCTGAAWNLLVVNTAAAEHGVSEAISARSGKRVLEAFTPTWVPDTWKPWGYVPVVGM